MKRISTIKKALKNAGYTVIEREDTLVLAQEMQKNDECFVHDFAYDTAPSDEITEIIGEGWFWECEYPTCFKLYRS